MHVPGTPGNNVRLAVQHRLGWVPATVVIAALTLSTIYSGHLLLRLYNAVPNAVLFGDIGEAAAGSRVSLHKTSPHLLQRDILILLQYSS